MSDPFNCPKCGRHDFGLLGVCPSCQKDEIERLRSRLAEAERFMGAASQPHDNSGNVSVQANLASTLTSHPSLSPTHYCVDCGALWRQCDDFSMNLRSPSCCDACNNAPVGPQIRPLYVAPTTADQPTADRETAP